MRLTSWCVLFLFLMAGTGCRRPENPPPAAAKQSAATVRMAERLALLERDVDPRFQAFANRRRAALFAARPVPEDPIDRARLHLRTSVELLRAGEVGLAVTRLEKLHDGSAVGKLPRELRRQISAFLIDAYLRKAEQGNCVAHHNPESCLAPIRDGGIHLDQRASRSAMAVLLERLEEDPGDIDDIWLLNLAAMTVGAWPEEVPAPYRLAPSLFESEYQLPRFRDVAREVGLSVVEQAGGSIVEDFDGDGHLDVIASSWGLTDQIRYFRSNGDGTYEERTKAAGLTGIGGGLHINQADYDNDGDMDVLVLRGAWLGPPGEAPNSLLRNDGNGVFDDVTEEVGILSFHPTQAAAWADYDNDGWLDLLIANESMPNETRPTELYHNLGNGTFAEVSAEEGLSLSGFVKGVAWGDYDNDGLIDLYVSRMQLPNILLRNQGNTSGEEPRFTDVTDEADVGDPVYSFPVWFWDYDNDGHLDILVAGYASSFDSIRTFEVARLYLDEPVSTTTPRLYRNQGDGTFEEISRQVGLDRVSFVMGANFGDLDNDGWQDAYFGTGAPSFRALMPNRMFRNDRGIRFQDVTTSGGFGHLQKGHGISFADIDGDGDQDIHAVMGGAYEADVFANALFRNPGNGNDWITLRLEGRRSNRSAFGARVEVVVRSPEGMRSIHRVVGTGSSFGANSTQLEVGLGKNADIADVVIDWPGGNRESFGPQPERCVVKLIEGSSSSLSRGGS